MLYILLEGIILTQRELIYIKTIAEEKSVSKAAKKLFVSQPSLSQCVARIEKSLGVELFKRTSYGLIPTYAGEKYISTAGNILKIYSDFETEISHVNSLQKGRLTIGITFFLSVHILPLVLPEFNKLYPNIEISVVERSSTELEKLLASGMLDFAIMHTHSSIPVNNGTRVQSILFDDPFVLVCSKNNPILSTIDFHSQHDLPTIDLLDFKDQPFIMVQKGQRIRQITDYCLQSLNIIPNIVLTTKNFETCKRLACEGVGITLLPLHYTKIFKDNYSPKYLKLTHPSACWTLCVMVAKNTYLSAAATRFTEMLLEKREIIFSGKKN